MEQPEDNINNATCTMYPTWVKKKEAESQKTNFDEMVAGFQSATGLIAGGRILTAEA